MSPHRRHARMTVDIVGGLRTDRLLLTDRDAERLRATLAAAPVDAASSDGGHARGLLRAALESAIVVPPDRIPADVITMRSRCVLKDLETGRARELVVVYPDEATAPGRISVLEPLGAALLGLSPGAVIGEHLPDDRTRLLRVESVAYQPEDAQEYHL